MKKLCFIAALLLCFSLCSCGVLVDTNTPKSAELSEKYSFYENSVASIRGGCNVSPEEADEIFLVLVNDCGVDKEMTVTPYANAPYSVKYGSKTLSMTLDGSTVSEVFDGDNQIFPAAVADTSSPEETQSSEVSETTEDILTDKEVIDEIRISIDYYNDIICTTIPLYADKKDNEKIVELLTESISVLDSDVDKYLQYMNDENLSENVREACQNLKTAFYGISETVLKPMLEVFNGNTDIEIPEYGQAVIDAQTMYIDKAEQLID